MNKKEREEYVTNNLKELNEQYQLLELESKKLRNQYSILKEKKNDIKQKMEKIANSYMKDLIYIKHHNNK